MAVDLHTHSNRSDGSDSPAVVIRHAADAGLHAIALTDHDTLDGIPEAAAEADRLHIPFVPGVEISCEWTPGTLHMVVLFLRAEPGPLQDRLADLQHGREQRNRKIVARLQDLGIDIGYDEVQAEAGEGVVGRPHFAAVLVRKGVVPDSTAAFNEYLANGRPAYVPRFRLEPADAIDLARSSGAVPVLAHPHTLGFGSAGEFADMLTSLRDDGLVGMEAYYAEYTPDERRRLADTARRFGLVPSGGSDYHGTYRPGVQVGTGHGDLVVPDEAWHELQAYAR